MGRGLGDGDGDGAAKDASSEKREGEMWDAGTRKTVVSFQVKVTSSIKKSRFVPRNSQFVNKTFRTSQAKFFSI